MNTPSPALKVARCLIAAIGLGLVLPAFAQDTMQGMDMQGMQTPAKKSPPKRAKGKHAAPAPAGSAATPAPASSASARSTQGTSMPGMDMSSMPMQQPSPPTQIQRLHFGNMIGERPKPGGLAAGSEGRKMPSMGNMSMSAMQGGAAPPDARSADYSDGHRYTDMPGMAMSDHALEGMLLLDQLEYAPDNHGESGAFVDGQFWYGADFDKLWIKSEGDYATGKLQDLRIEALWDHAISTYWGTQLGVRRDFGDGPDRTWAALGIQGLAPYWFDTEATLYVGQNGRSAARVELEYEELLTQRVVLQPKFEVNLYGKDDPLRAIGSGLSDTELGLRLRYELEREFGPYFGIVWRQRYGHTADFARAQGEPTGDLQFVAGLHVWF